MRRSFDRPARRNLPGAVAGDRLLGQSFGSFVALGVAARYPELPDKLIVSSGAGRIRFDRALEMIERLGGSDARQVAARNFEQTTAETQNEYVRVCLPLYNPSPPDPGPRSATTGTLFPRRPSRAAPSLA